MEHTCKISELERKAEKIRYKMLLLKIVTRIVTKDCFRTNIAPETMTEIKAMVTLSFRSLSKHRQNKYVKAYHDILSLLEEE
jgi:hypothetical protein